MTSFPEGRLSIRLRRDAAGRLRTEVASSRPLSAARVFAGKRISETLRLLPLLFRVCGTAQAAAATAAVESAAGLPLANPHATAREMLVLGETLREHLLRILTGWPAPGAAADPGAIPALIRLVNRLPALLYPSGDAFTPGGGALDADAAGFRRWLDEARRFLREQVFGLPADEWIALSGLGDLAAWIAATDRVAAAFPARILEREWAGAGKATVMALPPLEPQALAARLDAPDADEFVAAPRWRGEVFETGAFARNAGHPLVAAARSAHGDALLARTLARLVEVASIPGRLEDLLSRLAGASADTLHAPAGDGAGIGQAEAARGRLVHRVTTDGDRVASYRILAPTEWNFHPRGVLAMALDRLEFQPGLEQLAGLLVEAVDPCVGYDLQVDSDA